MTQILLGISLLVCCSNLFHSQAAFSLPLSEAQLAFWIEWAHDFRTYRNLLAMEGVTLFVVWLSYCKDWIPSFGIVSTSLVHSAQYLMIITFVVTLVLVSVSVGCQSVFGTHLGSYATLRSSVFTNFKMMTGNFDYEGLYEANS